MVRSERETEITAIYLAYGDGLFHFRPTETAGGAHALQRQLCRGCALGTLARLPRSVSCLMWRARDVAMARVSRIPRIAAKAAPVRWYSEGGLPSQARVCAISDGAPGALEVRGR